ncbi:MAG: hypothetical protein NT013_18130 [Planctomycetia bacterium]|nr:hypothetical protein [Planctomycetia bacterium]
MRALKGWMAWFTAKHSRNHASRRSLRQTQARIQHVEVFEVRSLLSASGLLVGGSMATVGSHTSDPLAAIQSSVTSDDQYYYFSSSTAGVLKSSNGSTLSITTDDIARLVVHPDGSYAYSLFFKGSNVGLGGGSESIDAFTVLSDGSLLVSTTGLVTVPGVIGSGTDLLKFVPTKLGSATSGTWSMFFRGSAVGLTSSSENIDGVAVLSDGQLILSTKGSFQVTGFNGRGADLMSFTPTQTGSATRGTWAAYLNSNNVGLLSYNVDALAIDGTGSILLSTAGNFRFSGLTGGKSDIVRFNPLTLGLDTIGSFDSTFALTASQFGLATFNIDGLQVGQVASDSLADPATTGAGSGTTGGGGSTGGTTTGTFQIEINYDGSGITASQQAIFDRAIQRWEQVILSEPETPVVDGVASNTLVIAATASRIDGVGGVLGNASPTIFRPTTKLPARGEMTFDSSDLASLESTGDLYTVILHEMGHVLGIGTVWTDLRLVQRVGTQYRFTGANAVAQYNAIFDTTSAYVPVESRGGSGTRGSHWSDSTFNNELMTGYINSGKANPLSKVTIGSLQDLGYTVNYAAADAYTAGSAVRTNVQFASASGSSSANLFGMLTSRLGQTRETIQSVQHQSIVVQASLESVLPTNNLLSSEPSVSTDDPSSNNRRHLGNNHSAPFNLNAYQHAFERLTSHLVSSLNI